MGSVNRSEKACGGFFPLLQANGGQSKSSRLCKRMKWAVTGTVTNEATMFPLSQSAGQKVTRGSQSLKGQAQRLPYQAQVPLIGP